MYIQKSIQWLWLYCWDYLSRCGLKLQSLFFFNVVCIHRSAFTDAHVHTSVIRAPSGNEKCRFFSPFLFNNHVCRDGETIAKIIQLCYLITTRAPEETNGKDDQKEVNTKTYKPDSRWSLLKWQLFFFFSII